MSLLSEMVVAASRAQTERVKTTFPGYVVSYNRTTQTADVQVIPRMRRRDPDTDEVAYIRVPVIPNVPVVHAAGDGGSVVIDMAEGDAVVVEICDRSIDEWRATGNQDTEPQIPRRWDFTDAVAIPGGQPNAAPLPAAAYAAGALVVRGDDVRLGSSAATAAVALAPDVLVELQALATALNTFITLYNTAAATATSSGVPTPLLVAPGLPSMATVTPSAVAATKVKAE